MNRNMNEILEARFAAAGVCICEDTANTGESRFAMTLPNGSGVALTRMAGVGVWQRAHHHCAIREEYFVFSGALVCASFNEQGKMVLRAFRTGQSFSCEPGTVHSVYRAADAVFGTVEFTSTSAGKDDFFPEPFLDNEIRSIGPDVLEGLIFNSVA